MTLVKCMITSCPHSWLLSCAQTSRDIKTQSGSQVAINYIHGTMILRYVIIFQCLNKQNHILLSHLQSKDRKQMIMLMKDKSIYAASLCGRHNFVYFSIFCETKESPKYSFSSYPREGTDSNICLLTSSQCGVQHL